MTDEVVGALGSDATERATIIQAHRPHPHDVLVRHCKQCATRDLCAYDPWHARCLTAPGIPHA